MQRLISCLFALLLVLPHPGLAQYDSGIALEYDPATVFTIEAGTEMQFELVARDISLNIIENWDAIGNNAILTVRGSNAETDSSSRSWSADPLGYSWLVMRLNGSVMTLDSTGLEQGIVLLYYTIQPSAFTLGRASLTFAQSYAESDISLSLTPRVSQLDQQSPSITVLPGSHDNYLVELTRPTPGMDEVFLLRRYEILVAPRDRYLNVISGRDIITNFTAAFPAEFELRQPGLTNIFAGNVSINGMTPLMLMSNISRVELRGDARQVVHAYRSQDTQIVGSTDPFDIYEHPPNPFALKHPPDRAVIVLRRASDEEKFTWVKSLPQDPYTKIRLSRFDERVFSDIVKYSVTIIDAATLTRAITRDADSSRLAASLTLTHGELAAIIDALSGSLSTVQLEVVWYATAMDYDDSFGLMEGPLYRTESSPPYNDPQGRPGFRLVLVKETPPMNTYLNPLDFGMQQNFPNPFSPSTVIPIDLPFPAYCRLLVHNLIGEEIELLYDGKLERGRYNFRFRGDGLAPGVYTYSLVMDGVVHTRRMLLLR